MHFMHSELFTLLKSWILMLIMDNVKKQKQNGHITVFPYQKSHFRDRPSFGEFFLDRGSC